MTNTPKIRPLEAMQMLTKHRQTTMTVDGWTYTNVHGINCGKYHEFPNFAISFREGIPQGIYYMPLGEAHEPIDHTTGWEKTK